MCLFKKAKYYYWSWVDGANPTWPPSPGKTKFWFLPFVLYTGINKAVPNPVPGPIISLSYVSTGSNPFSLIISLSRRVIRPYAFASKSFMNTNRLILN